MATVTNQADKKEKATVKQPKTLSSWDWKELRDKDKAPEDVIIEAMKEKENAISQITTRFGVLAGYLLQKCARHIPTTQIPTFAVMSGGDGTIALLVNPYWSQQCSSDERVFYYMHEAYHLFFQHLRADMDLRNDQDWVAANEIIINHVVQLRLGKKDHYGNIVPFPIPTRTTVVNGKAKTEPVIIDPMGQWRTYKADLRRQGLDPVEYNEFVSSDIACYTELKKMKNPPSKSGKKPIVVCVHGQGGDGDGDGAGSGPPMDSDVVSPIVDEAVEQAIKDAMKGSGTAKDELLDLMDVSDGTSDRASKMWGIHGAGMLRGQTAKTRKVEWWARWLMRTLGSKLNPNGGKLIYPKKRASILGALGHRTGLLHRGPERTKNVVLAIDTSGSMSQDFLNRLFEKVGKTSGVDWEFLAFDGEVIPFKLGQAAHGGGGTSFQVVVDYVEGRREVNGKHMKNRPDAVIWVTDGYAPRVRPQEAHKHIWLITPDGDMWPADEGMSCFRIDI